jgi:hypothetical protein
MKTSTITCVAILILSITFIPGCKTKFYGSGYPVNLSDIRPEDMDSLSFEVSHGHIIIWSIDYKGDCHSHELIHDGISRKEAVTILEELQEEHNKKTSNQGIDPTLTNAI